MKPAHLLVRASVAKAASLAALLLSSVLLGCGTSGEDGAFAAEGTEAAVHEGGPPLCDPGKACFTGELTRLEVPANETRMFEHAAGATVRFGISFEIEKEDRVGNEHVYTPRAVTVRFDGDDVLETEVGSKLSKGKLTVRLSCQDPTCNQPNLPRFLNLRLDGVDSAPKGASSGPRSFKLEFPVVQLAPNEAPIEPIDEDRPEEYANLATFTSKNVKDVSLSRIGRRQDAVTNGDGVIEDLRLATDVLRGSGTLSYVAPPR